ncbi:MAG: ATPase [Planctomycetota bacterium]|jgi:trk system potassium uptake protein TrkH|nr:ATPase [Planctomycetota bacterium]
MNREISFRQARISPTLLVLIWFSSLILVGTLVLCLPVSQGGAPGNFLDTAFMAVSASCVTGLAVVDLGQAFSPFGQLVILILLETGGLGVMTFAVLGFRLLGWRAPIGHQTAATTSLYQTNAAQEFKKSFFPILWVTLVIQLVGAILMFLSLLPAYWREAGGVGEAAWSAVFHAVSAFTNGGLTLGADVFEQAKSQPAFILILAFLVTLGSLGCTVLSELSTLPRQWLRHLRHKPRWLSFHCRVVLVLTSFIIGAGFIFILVFGWDTASSLWEEITLLFIGRTAGFSTFPLPGNMSLPVILAFIVMMFIGGSPGSCSGGVRTTSLAIWLASVRASLKNERLVRLFDHNIPSELVIRARLIIVIASLWNFLGVVVLSLIHPGEKLETLIFEQISAFGTVGLSLDFTGKLEFLSRLWIMLTMFAGRLGPLTIALLAITPVRTEIGRPHGRIMVG